MLPRLEAILALGTIAHRAVLEACGLKASVHRFAHHARHALQIRLLRGGQRRVVLFDSYHVSRYNTQTRRLTAAMFDAVLADVGAYLGSHSATREEVRDVRWP